MLTITDERLLLRVLSLPIDLRLKQLLIDRRDQLGDHMTDEARFIVVQPGDSLKALEQELGFSILKSRTDGRCFPDPGFVPDFEWAANHDFCFELLYEFTCDYSHVVLIQNSPMQNRLLRAFCLTYADGHNAGARS